MFASLRELHDMYGKTVAALLAVGTWRKPRFPHVSISEKNAKSLAEDTAAALHNSVRESEKGAE